MASDTQNDPVSRTTMTLTILHPQTLNPARMDDQDLANHISAGDFVAARSDVSTAEIPDAAVDSELEKIGGAPGHFAAKGPFIKDKGNA